METYEKNLFVLLADLDAENTIQTLLDERCHPLGIRQVDYDFMRYNKRDSGCCKDAANVLRPHHRRCVHALVIFDRHGSGRDKEEPSKIEADIEGRLAINGWGDRAAVVVIDPELESWVWSDSPTVDAILGWCGGSPTLREFLIKEQLLKEQSRKPNDPKAAMNKALRAADKRRSSRVFRELASNTEQFDKCQDRAFIKFKDTLQKWFPR